MVLNNRKRVIHQGWLFSSFSQKYHIYNRKNKERGFNMKKEDKITVLCQIVNQIIDENQLPDEDKIRKILEEKVKKDEKNRETCLATVIEKELEKAIKSGQICESNISLYKSVFEKSIKKSIIGNMPVEELSDMLIKKFVLQAGNIYEMDNTRLKCFTGMLQTGLNKMAEEELLDFVPEKHVYKNYLMCLDRGIRYIENPYTVEETEKIREWIDLHTNDIRGLALGLWFAGDVSMEEIANMKLEDNHNNIFRKWERSRFITKALELHPQNGDYVFMIINDREWEKITAQGLMMKLYHVSNKLGIKYKRVNKNEAIVCKE